MANYTSNYTGEQIDAAIAAVANKVDKTDILNNLDTTATNNQVVGAVCL